ncbi:MAG: hypothetical protein WCH34_14570 [Bacteroidota bacterium]
MYIIDVIIKETTSPMRWLKQIKNFPRICAIIESYYSDVKGLIPLLPRQRIDSTQLKCIVIRTSNQIQMELENETQSTLSLCFKVLFRASCLLQIEFKKQGGAFSRLQKKFLKEHLKTTFQINKELQHTFVKKSHGTKNRPIAPHLKAAEIPLFARKASTKQLLFIGEELNAKPWFSRTLIIIDLIRYLKTKPLIYCKEEYLIYIAYFFKRLKEDEMIEMTRGKGYMIVASRMILCDGKHPSARRLIALASLVNCNKEKYAHVYEPINSIFVESKLHE